jgi:triosephosphate isomerase
VQSSDSKKSHQTIELKGSKICQVKEIFIQKGGKINSKSQRSVCVSNLIDGTFVLWCKSWN